jgi:hypothetical protein
MSTYKNIDLDGGGLVFLCPPIIGDLGIYKKKGL